MSQHPSTFVIERPISMTEAVPIPAAARGRDLELRAQPARLPVPSGPPASEAVPPTPTTKRHRLRAVLTIGVSLLALAGAGYFGWQYWTVGRFQVSTDDAYVKADNTTISPKVSGYIRAVLVGDNEQVKAGEFSPRSTIAISGSRSIRQRPMWRPPRRWSPPSRPRLLRSKP
jgi:membrane fusion protein (multidrug efflux system)